VEPQQHDLILLPLTTDEGVHQFILVNAWTRLPEAGPFPSVEDAAVAAIQIATARHITVWHQPLDEHGRPSGALTRLFSVLA
jgi:hypothetical protein